MSTTQGGPGNIVTNGLVLYLDAANPNSYVSGSTTWNDISSGGNNGTLINGPTYSSANGGSIVFDGLDDYVNLGVNLDNIFTGSSFTVNMWVSSSINLPSGPNGFILISNYSGDIPVNAGFQLAWGGASDTLYAFGDGYLSRTLDNVTGLTSNVWYNITFVYVRNTSGNIYLDGINKTNTSFTNTVNAPSQNLKLGVRSDNNTFPWYGKMVITQVYNRALSDSEILQNYNSARARFGI
jgi:hypothetical protein